MEPVLNIERVKELLNDKNISDKQAEEIRDGFQNLVEVIFEKWLIEKQSRKLRKNY